MKDEKLKYYIAFGWIGIIAFASGIAFSQFVDTGIPDSLREDLPVDDYRFITLTDFTPLSTTGLNDTHNRGTVTFTYINSEGLIDVPDTLYLVLNDDNKPASLYDQSVWDHNLDGG